MEISLFDDTKSSFPSARKNPLSWCLRNRLILYGGTSLKGDANLTDLWEFHLDKLRWLQLNYTDKKAPIVHDHSVGWVEDSTHLQWISPVVHKSGSTCTHTIWTLSFDEAPKWTSEEVHNLEFCTGLVSSTGWKDNYKRLWLFSGAKEFCRGAPLSSQDSEVHHSQPLVNRQLWLIEKQNNFQTKTSQLVVTSGETLYTSKIPHPSSRCGAISWFTNSSAYIWGGLGFDNSNRLWYRNDLWHLNIGDYNYTSFTPYPPSPHKAELPFKDRPWFHTLSPSNVFLLCFTAIAGTALMFGLALFLKKMFFEYPRHHPSNNFQVRYSQLQQETSFETSEF